MKIVIAPQAFKGTISAFAAAEAIQTGVKRVFPEAITCLIPVADGGDGTLEVLIGVTSGAWGILPDGETAVIEMAKVCGLRNNPLHDSTFGLGELIKGILDEGFRSFIIGLGGSGTNDGGAGMAEALGVRFLDERGQPLPRGGISLQKLHSIDLSGLDPRVKESRFVMACDVDNPLLGPVGASRVYAPQKGASPKEVDQLESAMAHYAAIVLRDTGVDIATLVWGGSAGGTAAGAHAFLNALLKPGADLILKKLNFARSLDNADLVIVGEGRIDSQTAHHKAPFEVARLAKRKNIPVIAIVGSIGPGYDQCGIETIMPLTPIHSNTAELIADATEQALKLPYH